MRKLISILISLFVCGISYSYQNIPYAIKCYKCAETIGSSANGIRGIAHRTFYEGTKKSPDIKWVQYKCDHGHVLYINYDTNEKR